MLLAWHKYGGGKELLVEIYKSLNIDVVSYLYGPMPTQPFGWFKRPVSKVEDVKGTKFRTVGLAIDIYSGLGAAVNALPGAEIVPALDRGLLDGAEFNNASSDRLLGFPDVSKVCMLQSFHQCSEQFEIIFNRPKYNSLAPDLRAIIDNAVEAASADMSWKAIDRYSTDYKEMQEKQGVKFYKTPDAILRRQLQIWDEVMKKRAGENPLFKKVLDSQRAFAARAARWQNDTIVDFRMAYNHFFGQKKKAT
jgi:TRAP-type mannitol/chloroaromatic compound transport system substrate-binding protein